MDIAIFEQPAQAALGSSAEVWLRVRSNELVDLPRVKDKLDDAQAKILARTNGRPVAYYPDLSGGEDDNPYCFEDWWIFDDHGRQD